MPGQQKSDIDFQTVRRYGGLDILIPLTGVSTMYGPVLEVSETSSSSAVYIHYVHILIQVNVINCNLKDLSSCLCRQLKLNMIKLVPFYLTLAK